MKTMKCNIITGFLLLVGIIMLNSCNNKPVPVQPSSKNVYMIKYLEDSSIFTTFVQVLDKAGYTGFLGAYGSYTCFAPTNDAFKEYFLKKFGVEDGLASLSVDDCKKLVQIHMIKDTIGTSLFVEGKLSAPNMYGTYLDTRSTINSLGLASYSINHSSVILKSNVKLTNGLLHIVDKVIEIETASISVKLESMSQYSIFVEALKATGYYDTLNYNALERNSRFITVVAETNETFAYYGINSFSDLKARFKSNSDSITKFVEYHIIGSASYKTIDDTSRLVHVPSYLYLNEISKLSSIGSYVVDVPIVVTIQDSLTMLCQRDLADDPGTYYGGVPLIKSECDIAASNGVIHTAGKSDRNLLAFFPKKPEVRAVYWEFTDQAELQARKDVYRRLGAASFGTYILDQGDLEGITWVAGRYYASGMVQYCTMANLSKTSSNIYKFYNADYLNVLIKANGVDKMTIKTPFLEKARYKVWICNSAFRSYDNYMSVSYKPYVAEDNDDDVDKATDSLYVKLNSNVVTQCTNYGSYIPGSVPLETSYLISKGYKFYMIHNDTSPARGGDASNVYFTMYGTYIGTMDVKTAGYYRMKFIPEARTPLKNTTTITSSFSYAGNAEQFFRLDMIHFIPEDVAQDWPKFTMEGGAIYKPTDEQRAKNKSRYGYTKGVGTAGSTGADPVYQKAPQTTKIYEL